MSFFTIFTVVKILAKFGTTKKMLKASLSKRPYSKKPSLPYENPDHTPVYTFHSWQTNWLSVYYEVGGVAFLRIFVMFVNVDMSKTALIAGESTDSAAIFIELLKCFCEVLTIIFRMHVYVWWQGHN